MTHPLLESAPATPPPLNYEERPFYSLLDEAAAAWPDRPAILAQETVVTYRELLEKAEEFAASLQRLSVRPGDRVAILLPNTPELIIAFWGILKAGAIVVLANPAFTEEELEHNLSDAGARVLVSHPRYWSRISPLFGQPLRALVLLSPDEEEEAVPPDARITPWEAMFRPGSRLSAPIADPATRLALLQYTGGTTGVPKGAMISHTNILANVRQVEAALRLTPEQKHVFLAVLPLFHIYALTVCVGVGAAVAGSIVPFARFSPREVLLGIEKYRPTIFPGAPSLYLALLHQKTIAEHDLSSLQYCICGSAPMPQEYFSKFEEKTGARLIEGYGLTEASPITHLHTRPRPGKPGGIGQPLPGTTAKIVDMEVGDLTQKTGMPGELVISGPQVSLGYWNLPNETANTFRNRWLFTGDVATVDEDGYFTIVDRKKDMVIVGGFKVYPREIDEILYEHPSIREAISIGVFHPTRGEAVKVFIVPAEGASLTAEQIIAYCRKRLANYKVPRFVEFMDELPKSAVGKVLRRILSDRERAAQEVAR